MQGAAHGLRILLKQDRQVAGQLLLHLVPLNEDDVALRQGLLSHLGGDVLIMAHQLGGVYNLPHGVCNAVLLPYVMKFNLIGNMNRFKQIAHALGVESAGVSSDRDAEAGIQAVKCMSQRLGIPKSLKELGVKPEDFVMMAENAQKDVCSVTNPRTATTEQIVEIYRQAYEGE